MDGLLGNILGLVLLQPFLTGSFSVGLNFNSYLYPLFASASLNIGATVSNISSFDDKDESRLFTASGMFLITEGG